MQIALDIQRRRFDHTLANYRTEIPQPIQQPSRALSLLEAWDMWAAQSGAKISTARTHHKYIRRAIAASLLDVNLSSTIYNRRLAAIKKARKWAIAEGYDVRSHKLIALTPKKHRTKPVQPFSLSDLKKLAEVVKATAPHYLDFTLFLVISACRFGEVAALQGQNIQVEPPEITIGATLSRADDSWQYERKPYTKNGVVHVLYSQQLVEIVLRQDTLEDGRYVFTSVRGKPVDYTYYRRTVWIPALERAGLTYRKLHTTRHTALSMALEDGLSPRQVADIAGHKNAVQVNKTYAHVINKAKVPEIEL